MSFENYHPKLKPAIKYLLDNKIGFAQILNEYDRLFRMILALNPRPKLIVEIGSYRGSWLFMTAHAIEKSCRLIGIDLPDHLQFDMRNPLVLGHVVKELERRKMDIHILKSDSQKLHTVKNLIPIMNELPIDILHIDGNHSYEACMMDYNLYSPLVRMGGMILFHDVSESDPQNLDFGSPKAWKEISSSFKSDHVHEIIIDPALKPKGVGGIGVIVKP